MYSTIGNANWLSGALLLAMPIAMHYETTEKKKHWWRLVIIILSASLFANGTRGAFLGFFLFLTIWIIKQLLKRNLKTTLITMSFICLGFAIACTKNYYPVQRIVSTQTNIKKGLSGNLSAGEHRLFIYKTSMPLIAQNPVFGSGPDTFGKMYPQEEIDALLIEEHGEFKNPMRRLNTAHNEYIQLAVTIGLIGLGLFLILLIKGIIPIFSSDLSLSQYLSMAILAYAIHLLFTDASIGIATLFWVILGINLNIKKHKNTF